MDERAQDVEQGPIAGSRCDEPASSLPECLPEAPASQPAAPPSARAAIPQSLPRAAGGGAGGVAVPVILGLEPAHLAPLAAGHQNDRGFDHAAALAAMAESHAPGEASRDHAAAIADAATVEPPPEAGTLAPEASEPLPDAGRSHEAAPETEPRTLEAPAGVAEEPAAANGLPPVIYLPPPPEPAAPPVIYLPAPAEPEAPPVETVRAEEPADAPPASRLAEASNADSAPVVAEAPRVEAEAKEEDAKSEPPLLLAQIPTVAFSRQPPLPVLVQPAPPALRAPKPHDAGHADARDARAMPAAVRPLQPDAAETDKPRWIPPPPPFERRPDRREIDRHTWPSPVLVPPPDPRAKRVPPAALPLPAQRVAPAWGRRIRLAIGIAAAAVAGLAAFVLTLTVLYRWVAPPTSTLMLGQWLTGTPISQQWVPLERMSPNLLGAVILSEDGQFCRHRGVDWSELKEVIETAGDGAARGGSTITMQVVKNLFLWPSRSYVRKAVEIPLALTVETLWPKRRTLEIYLNVAEWGPGVFGAEAAARYHFRKSALALSPREAALLAVALPNPFDRRAGRPGPGTQRLADNLLVRMRVASSHMACLRTQP